MFADGLAVGKGVVGDWLEVELEVLDELVIVVTSSEGTSVRNEMEEE